MSFSKAITDAFVVIGGVACDEWLTAQGLKFRATKDVDMVLIVESLAPGFVAHFWDFIKQIRQDLERFLGLLPPDASVWQAIGNALKGSLGAATRAIARKKT